MKQITVTTGAPNVVSFPTSGKPTTVSSPVSAVVDSVAMAVGESIPVGYAVANIGNVAHRYDPTNPAHAYAFAGIAITSAVMGQLVVLQTDGNVFIPGWNLTPGETYSIGNDGALTTSAVLTPGRILLTLGVAINAETLLLRTDDPLYL